MKIAIPVYDVNRAGGTQRYVWYVADYLAGLGHEVDVITTSREGVEIPEACRKVAVPGGRLPVSALGVADMLSFPFRVRRRVSAPRYNVRYGPMGSLLVPGVVTAAAVHAAWVDDRGGRRSLFDRAACAIERRTAALPGTRWTAVSPLCADQLSKFYGLDRDGIAVVPPGVDLEDFPLVSDDSRRAGRRALGLPDDRFVVGTIANYNFGNKGVRELIDAGAQIGALVLVAGVDARQPELEARAERAGADVRFLGRVTDLPQLLHALDAFALASYAESYGMAVHEAMAVGLPVVASRQCGITSLIDEGTALVVDRRDPSALASALAQLQDPSVAAPMAAAAAAWARARTWRDTGAAMAREIDAWVAEQVSR